MPTWHKPVILQHNKERIAGVDAAADDDADTMIMMIKIMMIKITVNEDDGDEDGNNDDDDEFNQAELKNMQEILWWRNLKQKNQLIYTMCMLQR